VKHVESYCCFKIILIWVYFRIQWFRSEQIFFYSYSLALRQITTYVTFASSISHHSLPNFSILSNRTIMLSLYFQKVNAFAKFRLKFDILFVIKKPHCWNASLTLKILHATKTKTSSTLLNRNKAWWIVSALLNWLSKRAGMMMKNMKLLILTENWSFLSHFR